MFREEEKPFQNGRPIVYLFYTQPLSFFLPKSSEVAAEAETKAQQAAKQTLLLDWEPSLHVRCNIQKCNQSRIPASRGI